MLKKVQECAWRATPAYELFGHEEIMRVCNAELEPHGFSLHHCAQRACNAEFEPQRHCGQHREGERWALYNKRADIYSLPCATLQACCWHVLAIINRRNLKR